MVKMRRKMTSSSYLQYPRAELSAILEPFYKVPVSDSFRGSNNTQKKSSGKIK